ncbi:MAG: hypothetical protein ACPL8I_13495, partial [Chloroflexaceae bacterium]
MATETETLAPRPAENGATPVPQGPVPPYPFVAIVGQAELKLGLILCVVNPTIGGVMVMGHRGTAKSTAVRALAAMLPPIKAVAGCPYSCAPEADGF